MLGGVVIFISMGHEEIINSVCVCVFGFVTMIVVFLPAG